MTKDLDSSFSIAKDSDATSYTDKNLDSSSHKDFLEKITSNVKRLDLILIPTAGGVLAWLAVISFCGIASIILFASQFLYDSNPQHSYSKILSIMGVGFLIALSSFISGTLLGFIFGIPRILPKESHSSISSGKPLQGELYGENSNVDQISDWLTKILVGAGLTQLIRVPETLQQYSENVKPALGDLPSSGVFGVSILIFFLVDGFIIGYLWTRRSAARELLKAMYER